MGYSIIHIVKNREITYQNGITDDEVSRIKTNLDYLREVMIEIDYCSMVRGNVLDFLKDTESNGAGTEGNFVRLNRYMLNWLGAFYAWIEYHERYHKTVFSSLKKKYYDNNFEYRFAYTLRKFSTHQAMCINRIHFDVLKESTVFEIGINNILLYKSELKKDICRELETMADKSNYIDAVDFTCRFITMFEQMQKELWLQMKASYLERIHDVLSSVQEKSWPLTESYICDEDGEVNIPVGMSIHQFIDKTKNMIIPDQLVPYLIKN